MSALLTVLSWPFVAALYAADALGNVVGHGSEFQADRRVVRMGYGRNLAAALRRVISLGGSHRPIGWRAAAGGEPPAGPHPRRAHRRDAAPSGALSAGSDPASGAHLHPDAWGNRASGGDRGDGGRRARATRSRGGDADVEAAAAAAHVDLSYSSHVSSMIVGSRLRWPNGLIPPAT